MHVQAMGTGPRPYHHVFKTIKFLLSSICSRLLNLGIMVGLTEEWAVRAPLSSLRADAIKSVLDFSFSHHESRYSGWDTRPTSDRNRKENIIIPVKLQPEPFHFMPEFSPWESRERRFCRHGRKTRAEVIKTSSESQIQTRDFP